MAEGFFVYRGKIKVEQSIDACKLFFDFLLLEKFDIILEIGTKYGGFSLVLSDIIKHNKLKCKVITIDKFNYGNLDLLAKEGIDSLVMDIFASESIGVIKKIKNPNNKILVLCDNGNKPKEFYLLSNIIQGNDFIMVHDYATTIEAGNKMSALNIWHWFEVYYSDIQDSIIKNDLTQYKKIDFLNVFWGCFSKSIKK